MESEKKSWEEGNVTRMPIIDLVHKFTVLIIYSGHTQKVKLG